MDSLCRVCLAESKQNLEDRKPVTGASWAQCGPHASPPGRTWSPSSGCGGRPRVLPFNLPCGAATEVLMSPGSRGPAVPGPLCLPFSMSDSGDASLPSLSPKFTGASDLKGELSQPLSLPPRLGTARAPPALITHCSQQRLEIPATTGQPVFREGKDTVLHLSALIWAEIWTDLKRIILSPRVGQVK